MFSLKIRKLGSLKRISPFTLKQALPIKLHADNKGALHMAHEGSDSTKTRHMSVRYHFVKDLVTGGTLKPLYVHSSENAADGLTKALPRPAHERSTRRLLGQGAGPEPTSGGGGRWTCC